MLPVIIQIGACITLIWLIYVTSKQLKVENHVLTTQLREIDQNHKHYHQECEQRERAYKRALAGSDKATALKLGRDYYSYLRGGQLTLADERALTRDLSTMH